MLGIGFFIEGFRVQLGEYGQIVDELFGVCWGLVVGEWKGVFWLWGQLLVRYRWLGFFLFIVFTEWVLGRFRFLQIENRIEGYLLVDEFGYYGRLGDVVGVASFGLYRVVLFVVVYIDQVRREEDEVQVQVDGGYQFQEQQRLKRERLGVSIWFYGGVRGKRFVFGF